MSWNQVSGFALETCVLELHALRHMSWNQVSNMVQELNGFGIICQNLSRIKCHCNHISGNKHLESDVLESKSLESNETHPNCPIHKWGFTENRNSSKIPLENGNTDTATIMGHADHFKANYHISLNATPGFYLSKWVGFNSILTTLWFCKLGNHQILLIIFGPQWTID